MKLSRILIGILILAVFFLGAIGSISTQEDASTDDNKVPVARFAFYHAAPNTPAVNIIVDDEQIFTNVMFNDKTEFKNLKSGEPVVKITSSETGQEIFAPVKANLRQGRDHILFITGLLGAEDDEPELTAKMLVKKTRPAFFRFYNTSPDLGPVNVFLDDNLYFQNAAYGKPTKFEKIGFGSPEFVLKMGDEAVVGPMKLDFEPGKAYTILLVGMKDGGTNTKLQVKIIEE